MSAVITRSKAIRADFASWDGKTATHTRLDASGGTVTGLAIGNEVDVLQVFGNGTDRTRATISAALSHINTTAVTLVFAPGTWSIDNNLTIPSNFTCHIPRGCVFSVDSGKTLTFSGPIQRESDTWTSGSGTVTYTASNNVLVHSSDLADSASVANGDALVAVKYVGTGPVAINLHDYIEDDGYNLTGFVPQNLKAALRNRSSTTDISAYLQAAVDAVADERTYGAVKLPSWRAYLETKITLTEGISIFGNGYYASDLVLVGSIVGMEYAPGVRTEIGSTFAHFTIRGLSNTVPLASHLMRFVNCTGPTLIGMRLRNTAASCVKLETLVIGTNIYGGIFESFTAYGVDVGSSCSVLNIIGPRVNANAIAGTAFVGVTHADGAEGIALQNVNVNGSDLLNHVLLVATGSTANRIGVRECYAEDLAASCIKATGTGKFAQLTVDNAQVSGADSIQIDLDNSVAHEDIVIRNVRNGGATGGMKLISLGSTRNFDVSNMSVSAGVRLNGYTGFTHIRKEEDGRIYLDGRTYGTAGPFTQSNVAASQTNVALTGSRWTAPRAGSITGIVVKSNEARTAGTLTVEVWKNTGLAGAAGAATGLTAVLNGTNTSAKATTQDPNTDTFVAGDELFVSITTDGSWAPTTADIQVWIEVEC